MTHLEYETDKTGEEVCSKGRVKHSEMSSVYLVSRVFNSVSVQASEFE